MTETVTETETITPDDPEIPAAPGTLTLRTRPWARIYLDGTHLGDNFLLRKRAVEGGDHRVRLVCPQQDNREKEFQFRVDGDDVNLGCWDFETMAPCE